MKLRIKIDMKEGSLGFKLKLRGGADVFVGGWAQGASTTCYVGLSRKTEGVSGKYYADCNECSCSSMANDESEAHNLWRQSRALIHRRLRLPAAAA